MQISASTLLVSQQAAPLQAKPAAGFTQALEKTSGFQPLKLKQTAPQIEDPAPSLLQPTPKNSQKPGSTIDIKV